MDVNIFISYQIFARPFVGAMEGHIDAVSCMAKNPNHLKGIFSGSMDGGALSRRFQQLFFFNIVKYRFLTQWFLQYRRFIFHRFIWSYFHLDHLRCFFVDVH